MRPRRRPATRLLVPATVLAAIAAGAWLTVRPGPAAPSRQAPAPPASWQGLVGDAHPAVSLAGRMIVVLKTPSVAQRIESAGRATEAAERRWTAADFAAQQQVLTDLARHGESVRPDYSYARVLDGFSAMLQPAAVALLERNPEVAGVYPVQVDYPASISASSLRSALGAGASAPNVGVPGLDGTGISIALLDTGVDLTQPYLGGRVEPGIDIVGGSGSAAAQRDPQAHARIESHGTELAGILVGSNGPDGMHGVAPGATVLPIRVAGWQPTASGGEAIYGRSDQLIAGLERAVDPNGDGDTHDAVRIALIGVAEPFDSFDDTPEAQAVAGALALDVLVVAPAGNDGAAGPLYGSIAGPAGAPAVLSVGATDPRPSTSTVRVVLTRGLDVLDDGSLPLLASEAPARSLSAPVAVPGGRGALTGKAALVPDGTNPDATVASAVRNGAVAVLLYGRSLPSGSLGDPGVPVVGIPAGSAQEALVAIREREPVDAAIGSAAAASNRGEGHVAPFSSRGLTFDGLLAPQLVAPGIGIATAEPGGSGDGEPAFAAVTGTSVSAAEVAGAAALVAQSRPGLSAEELASLLAGAARPTGASPTASGAGAVDVGRSIVSELAASVTSLGFGPWTGPRWHETRRIVVQNVSTRPLTVTPTSSSGFVSTTPAMLTIAAGGQATVKVTAAASSKPALPVVTGTLELRPSGSPALRIPWAINLAPPAGPLISTVRIAPQAFSPSSSRPAILQVVAGSVSDGNPVQIDPVGRLQVSLYTASGAFRGVLEQLTDLLPGDYSFGITGRSTNGAPLAAGGYELRIVAWPVIGKAPSRAQISFRIQ